MTLIERHFSYLDRYLLEVQGFGLNRTIFLGTCPVTLMITGIISTVFKCLRFFLSMASGVYFVRYLIVFDRCLLLQGSLYLSDIRAFYLYLHL